MAGKEQKLDLQRIVAVRPGSAAETPLRFTLPADKANLSVEAAVKYGLGGEHGRAAQRRADAIKAEMKGDYGATVNGSAVKASDPIGQYFTERTVPGEGVAYLGVDVVVASKQTGGIETKLYEV